MNYYNKILFKDNCPGVTYDIIEKFEKSFAIPLIQEHKEFLIQRDGGYLHEDNKYYAYNGKNGKEVITIEVLYGLVELNERETIQETLEILSDIMPVGVIPIGNDGFGNEIGLIAEGSNCGAVVFLDHEKADEDTGKLTPCIICSSFVDLLLGLHRGSE